MSKVDGIAKSTAAGLDDNSTITTPQIWWLQSRTKCSHKKNNYSKQHRWQPFLGQTLNHFTQVSRMSFIPEWVSFQNEVCTVFTWKNQSADPPPRALCQNELSFQNENFVQIEKNSRISFRLANTEQNFVPVSHKQIQWHLWEWNELLLEWTSFGMKVIPVPCKQLLSWDLMECMRGVVPNMKLWRVYSYYLLSFKVKYWKETFCSMEHFLWLLQL